MEIPSKETVLPHTKTAVPTPTVHRTVKKRWLTAPMAVAMSMILIIGVAAAGGIILSHLNANVLTQNSTRLQEVPEGYVGIYTIEDLMAINTSLQDGTAETHYIFMNESEKQ